MIKLENTQTYGWDAAIRGMRNPMNSWDKSDSYYCEEDCPHVMNDTEPARECDNGACGFCIGINDHELMMKLAKAGSDHRKYMRMIIVSVDITTHHTWWAEFDTYKVGTVRNSCSKMHRIHIKEFSFNDFSTEGIKECGLITTEIFTSVINELERLRILFNKTNDKKYWRAIIELLPMGYNIKATVMLNYEVLRNMYHARKNHKLDEWHAFCDWIKTLPYSENITGEE